MPLDPFAALGIEQGGPPPASYPMVAAHPAPDGSGMINMSDQDWSRFKSGQSPAPAGQAKPTAKSAKGPDPFAALGIDASQQFPAVPPPIAPGRGAAQNFAAGANRSIFGALGAPVDLAAGAINAGLHDYQGFADKMRGSGDTAEPQITNPIGGSEWIGRQFGRIAANPNDVHPVTEAERMASAAGGAAAQVPLMALGGAATQAAGATGLAGGVAGALRNSMGATGPAAALTEVAAGVGGGAGQLAEDKSPEWAKPYANAAGNLAGAGATGLMAEGARRVGGAVANQAGLMGVGRKQNVGGVNATASQADAAGRKVGNALGAEGRQIVERATGAETEAREIEATLADPATNAADRAAAEQRLAEIQPTRVNLVPGAEPTTAQLAPTPGAVDLDQALRVADRAPFNARATAQNNARVAAVQAVQPEGNPGSVGEMFTRQLQAIDALGQQTTAGARQGVQQATEGLGATGGAQANGEAVRTPLIEANKAAKTREGALWTAIDPDGKLALPLGAVQRTAQGLLKELRPGLGDVTSGQEMQILSGAASLPAVVPFREAGRLWSNIGAAERALRAAPGNEQSLRRLGALKDSLRDAIADGAETAAQSNGEVAARLAAMGRADGSAGTGNSAGVLAGAGAGDRGQVPGGDRGPGQAAGVSQRAGHADAGDGASGLGGRDSGVANGSAEEALTPNFDVGAAARYAAARAETASRKQTYGQGPVGAVLRGGQQGAKFRIEDASVPRQFLTGNAVEPARVKQYIKAVGGLPQAVTAMRDALVADLREKSIVQADGTLKPEAFTNWIRQRGRTIDQFPGLRDELGNAATAQKTLDDVTAAHVGAMRAFQAGVAKHFLHDDPLVAIRRAFGSGNPTETFTELARAVRGNPDAEAGLRRGVVDFILEKHSSTTPSGEATDFLKADAFKRWVRENRGPLRALFGGQGMQTFDMVAADLRRVAQKSNASEGSPTASNEAAKARTGIGAAIGHSVPLTVMTLIGERLGEMAGHNIVGAVALPALGFAVHSLRQAGIKTIHDLTREAMLHPDLARALVQRPKDRSALSAVMQRRIGAAVHGAVLADMANATQRDVGQ